MIWRSAATFAWTMPIIMLSIIGAHPPARSPG